MGSSVRSLSPSPLDTKILSNSPPNLWRKEIAIRVKGFKKFKPFNDNLWTISGMKIALSMKKRELGER